jgi:hypothetical protein
LLGIGMALEAWSSDVKHTYAVLIQKAAKTGGIPILH